MAGLIAADASALIAYLDPDDADHAAAIQGLVDVDRFIVHPVTLTEVLVHPVRQGTEVDVVNILASIDMVASDMAIEPMALARLRADSGLKLPDCLVLATAIWHHVGVLTFDDQLRAAAEDIAKGPR